MIEGGSDRIAGAYHGSNMYRLVQAPIEEQDRWSRVLHEVEKVIEESVEDAYLTQRQKMLEVIGNELDSMEELLEMKLDPDAGICSKEMEFPLSRERFLRLREELRCWFKELKDAIENIEE